MASTLDHAFFYNSNNGDRLYDADSFEHWLKKFFTSGVFEGDCQVTSNGDMTVNVAAGYANADGKVKIFADAQTLQLETAGSTYGRIDTIVIERNDADRDVTMKVVTGGYSSNPAATAPVRSNGVYQLVLAQIAVAAGATEIKTQDITDTRLDTSICGIVAQAVDHLETTQFYTQIQAALDELKSESETNINKWQTASKKEFTTWFNTIKDQLSTDAAGALEEQIYNMNLIREVELLADDWGTADGEMWTQAVEVEGLKTSDNPLLVSMLEREAPLEEQKRYAREFGILSAGMGVVDDDGIVVFIVYKKITTDIIVGLKGV